jgi:hypothetical protein
MTDKPTTYDPTRKPKTTREYLLWRVEEYLVKNPQVSPPGFGHSSIGDTSVVKRLREGGDVTTTKFDRMIRYMGNPNEKEKSNGNESEVKIKGKEDRQ